MKFKYYILVVLFSLLSGLVSPASAQSRQGALVVAAVEAYNAKDLAKAEAILKRVLALDPKNDAALYYMAMCHLVQNRAEEAEACLESAIAADPTNFWYRQRLASLYAMTSRPELTIEMYEKLLEDFPKKNELYSELVDLYISQGDVEKALKTLDEIETVFGMTETIAIYRYNLLRQSGKQEEALASLEEYNSRYSSAYVLSILAEHEISMYNDSTALVYYDEALELAPDFSPALLGKAETLRMARKYNDYFDVLSTFVSNPSEPSKTKTDYLSAVMRGMDPKFVRAFSSQMDTVMTSLLEVHPSDSTVLNLAGLYYYSLDRQEQAEDCFRQNAQAHPASLSAAAGYVEYLMYAGRWEVLSVEGRKAYERFPEELGFLEMASVGDYNLKDFHKVLEACDEVLKAAPADSSSTLRAWSTKGDVYHRIGEVSKSYKAYEKALKVNPDYVYVLNNYAYYLSEDGRKLKKALEMSRKTIEAEPDNATYLDTYGWILHLLGRSEEAKTHFKRAMLYGGKDSPVIMDHYAEVLFAVGEYDKAMVYWNKALLNNNGRIPDLEERINLRKQQANRKK
jgi:tetratricopeptide (TPR) repeat protein